ncbi:type III pantothenate kinase [Marinobacter litoralis]|uniref:type III pantothenate kinase n=1 Tax=Marinobacter litoralis TaxID=187981 RepID=UPI0018ED2BDF|nr:type III pantothenate kinase [Marinobacter litoralis]MBJ6138795.1 type III pantothenate kinase [Marinobacter litoralis]
MILLIDSGNTRIKWRLMSGMDRVAVGAADLRAPEPFSTLAPLADQVSRVCVSTVASEASRKALEAEVAKLTPAPIHFFWSEAERNGLQNSYQDVSRMGADRWHAMVAAWSRYCGGCAIIDAGSAVTVDYIDGGGMHLGGFILPGLGMMRRSLKLDAARIGFDVDDQLNTRPGQTTGECANHGLAWLTEGVIRQAHRDAETYGLQNVLITGGDASRFVQLGLRAEHVPELVLDGLQRVVEQDGLL